VRKPHLQLLLHRRLVRAAEHAAHVSTNACMDELPKLLCLLAAAAVLCRDARTQPTVSCCHPRPSPKAPPRPPPAHLLPHQTAWQCGTQTDYYAKVTTQCADASCNAAQRNLGGDLLVLDWQSYGQKGGQGWNPSIPSTCCKVCVLS